MNIDSKKKKKKKHSSRNRKATFLPITIVILLFGLVVWNNIRQETKLPAENWSRSISVPANSNSTEPIVHKEDDQYVVYTHQNDGIKKTILDEKLDVKAEKTINLPIDERSHFWSNGEQYAFISSGGELIVSEGGKNKVIDKNAEYLAAAKDRFAYSKGNEVYVYDPKTSESKLIFTANERIAELTGQPESSSFLAVAGEKVKMESFFLHDQNGKYDASNILSYEKSSTDKIYNFRFAESKEKLHIIYTFYSSKQGTKSFKTYYGAAPLSGLNELSYKQISYKDPAYNYKLENPKYQELYVQDGKPAVLFAAAGPVSNKKKAGNIYNAVLADGKWTANRISTTKDFSSYPLKADDQTVFWLNAKSVTDFQVYAASKDPEIIKESQSIQKQDIYSALFDACTASIISFIAMTNAFVWVVPPILFLGILYVVRIDMIEDEKPWVKWLSIVLFILTQVYVIQSLFNHQFYTFAPDYLTFKGSSFVIPVVVSIIALYVMQIVKNKDWGLFAQVSYFIGVTVLFQLFVVGTYVY
ncbi:hypothetical protein [Bacillus sp. NEB1478]|uniref:hypothetical protein n=1 Tax=Bacillus sp. NEB1478 TaxID=3073816 RepID=UPI002873D80C|nr:hypothetical protein [Bacillus sp. NEB1478]WNB92223.1 hypothetical protein RGB74_00745 [Bacillus sp. NEB1478]